MSNNIERSINSWYSALFRTTFSFRVFDHFLFHQSDT